jgi:cytochrome c oxidase subunit 2
MIIPFVRRRERGANEKWFLWGGGIALPAVTLTLLVPYVFTLGHETRRRRRPTA